MYSHQLSYSQELPPNVLDKSVPFGVKQTASSPFRLLNIFGASSKKFIVLVPDKESIIVKEITNYEIEPVNDHHLWQFIQVGWDDGNIVLLKHVVSGRYLCLPEKSDVPKCMYYGNLKHERYLWNLQERTLFFMDPDQKYFTYKIEQNQIVAQNPVTLADAKKGLPEGVNLNNSLPIGGIPFIRIQSDNKTVKMSGVNSQYYSKNLPLFHPFWSNTVWNVGKGLNDPENEWYPLLQRGVELAHLNIPPTSQPMGLGLLKHWEAGKRAADRYNKCSVPLKKRFVDTKTQTKPEQKTPPKIMFGFTSGAQERLTEFQGSGFRENFEHWQYLDIMMFIAYSQGWPPPELKLLKVPTGLGIDNDGNDDNLFSVLEGFVATQGAGIFSMPPKSYIESAHKNGCKVYSVLFFQQNFFGGKWKWWSDFLKDRDIYAKKLVDFAEYYGIDGYFVNFEAEFPGDIQDTPGTDCSMFSGCDEGDCKGYWCNYTVGGVKNCTGKECSIGKWIDDGNGNVQNVGFDGQDINKDYFIDFLKKVKSYRKEKNVQCDICAYASMGPNGDSHNYTSGITSYLTDFWYDPETKEPIVDSMLSMPPGGQNNPTHVDYTYSHSSEAVKGCVEQYDNDGWPPNTGPKAIKKPLSSDLSCGQTGNTNCDDIPLEQRQAGCLGNDDNQQSCENAGCCWKTNDTPDQHPFCYLKQQNPICPNGDWTSCGKVDNSQALIPNKRFLDFFVGTTGEKGFNDPNDWTYGYTPLDKPEPWDKYLYCGTFDGCDNYKMAITQPMSSFFLWQANLSQGNMGANKGRTYEMNTELYQSLYAGKTGLVVHNLGADPYTNVKDAGISNYVPEKSVLSELPFHTSFSLGNGANFYIDGEPQLYFGSWTDNVQDFLPTWRWWSRQMTTKNEKGQYIESMILGMDYSRSYNGGSCLRVQSIANMVDTDFHLFKTKFSTDKPIKLKVCLSAREKCSDVIKIGYTLGSDGDLVNNPHIHYFKLSNIDQEWSYRTIDIPVYTGDYISSICIFAKQPSKKPYTVFIGSISMIQHGYIEPNIPLIDDIRTFNVGDGTVNCQLSWKQVPNILYYNVFCGKYYMGRVYGSGCSTLLHDKIYFNVANQKKNNNMFWIEGITTSGNKLGRRAVDPSIQVLYRFMICAVIIVLSVVLFRYQGMQNIIKYPLLALMGIVLIFMIISIARMKFNLTLGYQPGNSGELTKENVVSIENWPHCKHKAFNINFDDNRPKTWTWLLTHLKASKSPIKVTFFINTLWLDRDLEKYKKWIKEYNVDYGAHGHWHMNHTSDNMPTASEDYCRSDNPDPNCCDNGKPKQARVVTDQDLANNDIACANFIRDKIYNDQSRDLVFAFPYGALPFDDDGNPKPITMDMLQKEFIAARHVTWGQVLQYPIKSEPDTLLGGCSDYQGQPVGCEDQAGGCNMKQCSVNYLKNIYDENMMNKGAGPQYSWPGGIDLNLDPSCENCNILRQMEIRKNSLIQLLESEKPYSIMIWGHDFHPTNDKGKTYPCDPSMTLGGCNEDDKACQNNAYVMANETGVKDWLAAKGEYHCPTDITSSDDSCAQTCVRGKIVDGTCTDNNVFYNACANPTGYYPAEAYSTSDVCEACEDSCWDPSIGHKLLEMFDLVKDRDDIWFAHFVEIVQYLYNRQYSELVYDHSVGRTVYYNLVTKNTMKKYPLTLSFPESIKGDVKIDGRQLDVKYSKYARKYYVVFQPADNTIHKLELNF